MTFDRSRCPVCEAVLFKKDTLAPIADPDDLAALNNFEPADYFDLGSSFLELLDATCDADLADAIEECISISLSILGEPAAVQFCTETEEVIATFDAMCAGGNPDGLTFCDKNPVTQSAACRSEL